MNIKVLSLLLLISFCYMSAAPLSHSEESTFGAHVKLTVFDHIKGKSNDREGDEYAGMSLTEVILYFSGDLSDKISAEIQPLFNTVTGATPRFGNKIGENKYSNAEPVFNEFRKAIISVMLPKDVEMSLGIVKPKFTWDYGSELFWEEEVNAGKFTANDFLGAMHETGIEFYKPLEVSKVSLPTYLYILNGGPGGQKNLFNDNNGSPTVMLHVEPEIGPLRLQASFARGKYDDKNKYDMTRYSTGVQYVWDKLSARMEMAGGVWEKSIPAEQLEDATPIGYYGKLIYQVLPWASLMLHYDYAKHNFNGFISTAPGEEIYKTFTPGVQIKVASSSMIQIQYDIADWSQWKADGDETLKFQRLTFGWRSTF